MIGFKEIPKKSIFTVFVVAVISILLVYVDTRYNDPLPIEEVSFSEELNNNPEPIQNKQIHVVQRGESLSVIFDDKEKELIRDKKHNGASLGFGADSDKTFINFLDEVKENKKLKITKKFSSSDIDLIN